MSTQLTVAELTKAARNLRKIELFLAARRDWEVDPADVEDLKALREAADRLAFTVGQRALALGVDAKLTSDADAQVMPPGIFDGSMLAKFGSFLGRLDGWFVAQGDSRLERGGDRVLGTLQASIDAIRTSLIVIAENHEPVAEADPPPAAEAKPAAEDVPPPESDTPRPPVRPVTTASDDIYEGTRGAKGGEPPERVPPAQIAFTMADAAPMYTWVGSETVELTPLAMEKIQQLFQDQDLKVYKYQLEKFFDEVRMRIETAPGGHVLVVKVRTIGEEVKPFLSYVSEDSLD